MTSAKEMEGRGRTGRRRRGERAREGKRGILPLSLDDIWIRHRQYKISCSPDGRVARRNDVVLIGT